MPSLFLVAGDPSGDAHGARLVTELSRLDPTLTFTGLGGPHMRQAGVELLDDLTTASSIGPFDAATHLGHFVEVRRRIAEALAARRPDAVILIDFGDFNLPVVAPLAKRAGARVLYYVSPQLWAWGAFRLRWVRRYVDHMLVLFKFEEDFYRQRGVPVTWVGHPLADRVGATPESRDPLYATLGLNPARMTVGLLPGSRASEVRRHVPLMLAAARRMAWHMPGLQFLLPKSPGLSPALFSNAANSDGLALILHEGHMDRCLGAMDAALVASGTATVETALRGVPMAVVYRTSWPTYLAAKSVVRVPHVAMVNVMAGRAIVPEFVQGQATPNRLAEAVVGILRDKTRQDHMRQDYQLVRDQLGSPGAATRAAREVLARLR